MNGQNKNEDRDKVLYAFHLECERPTAEQIIDWVRRYPEYAEDIRAHAAVSRDWAASDGEPALEASGAMLDRGYSNALNLLYNAEAKASARRGVSAVQSFHDVAAARGKEVYQIAGEIDIARGVVADLFNGGMLAPVRKRLVDAICNILQMTRAMFDAALTHALAHPRFGPAKSDKAPTITPRSCDEIIRDSNMTPERKRYWLEED